MLQHYPLSKARFTSPLIQEIVSAAYRTGQVKVLHHLLETRFGSLTCAIRTGLEEIKEEEILASLVRPAAACTSLEMFENCLRQALDAPPVSKRAKRRSRKPSA